VERDAQSAVNLFRTAAEAGDLLGQVGLAECLQRGVGCAVDHAHAMQLLTNAISTESGGESGGDESKADDAVRARAHEGLVKAYTEGLGVDVDADLAQHHSQQASSLRGSRSLNPT
jgi:TPR repeat protein